jgi:general stress protein 26
MTTQAALKATFWKALAQDRTAMVGCSGVYPKPMTAQIEDGNGPIWFFTSRENDLAQATTSKSRDGLLMFTSKGHDLFATVGGSLRQDNDSRTVDRLWNPFVAAWYSGKDDPNLRLLRFDPGTAEIWQNASSLLAGIKMLIGINPQLEFNDDVAKVRLGQN